MQLSYNWLKEIIDIDMQPNELEEVLTMLGIEVEGIENYKEKYKNFITAEVTSCEKHPDADKLSICKVSDGTSDDRTVICGAPNVATGQKVILAAEGAYIPAGDFTIGKRKIRGVESNGMICSQAELGLGNDSSGIWVLDNSTPVGQDISNHLGLDDIIFDISLTPNRPDCLSHIGVARDLAAYLGKNITKKSINISEIDEKIEDNVKVVIDDIDKCPRYAARVVKNAKVGQSPQWLKNRLVSLGLRPVNVIVDITNFVLMETGQPLHAFDFDTVAENTIVVKTAENGQKYTTLDSKERTLDNEMLLICDPTKPVGIAGVMGGENSEITDNTRNILIESAYFDPSSIRKTSKKLGISSDAAYRFERGVDIDNIIYALNRAAQLMEELAGGEVLSGIIDEYPKKIELNVSKLRFQRARDLIGIDINNEQIKDIMKRLSFETIEEDSDSISLKAPSWRVDIFQEVDLIEEVARLYYYDNITPDMTSLIDYNSRGVPEKLAIPPLREIIQGFLTSNGYNEILTQNMIDPKSSGYFTDNPVLIANPLGEELSIMRPSLVPSMIKTILNNFRVGNYNLNLYEIGRTFNNIPKGGKFIDNIDESENLIIALTGYKHPKIWNEPARHSDFYDIKGITQDLFEFLRIEDIKYKPNKNTNIYSANSLEIQAKKQKIGIMGELNQNMLKDFDIDKKVFCLELDLSKLYQMDIPEMKYKIVAPYPSILRDLGFVIDKEVEAEKVRQEIEMRGGKLLQSVDIFDVYEGKNIGEDKKSIAFSLRFSSPQRTLVDEEVDKAVTKIVSAIEKKFKAKLREF